MKRKILLFASVFGLTAIIFGAMAAHFLESKLVGGQITPRDIHAFETASKYQLFHSIALLLIVLLMDKLDVKLMRLTSVFFIVGVIIFSGSIYLLSTQNLIGIGNLNWLGPITPLGGLSFIAGWTTLFIAAFKAKNLS
ncbi:MAG: DUF423 domain-containing protein [Bacteroidia bacterium]